MLHVSFFLRFCCGQVAGGDVYIRGCERASVFVPAQSRFVSVAGCSSCVVHLGVVSTVLRIHECSGLTLTAPARAVRVR